MSPKPIIVTPQIVYSRFSKLWIYHREALAIPGLTRGGKPRWIVPVCPICSEPHFHAPGPLEGYPERLDLLPCRDCDCLPGDRPDAIHLVEVNQPEFMSQLADLQSMPNPWRVVNGPLSGHTSHPSLRAAQAALDLVLCDNPRAHLVNDRLLELSALTYKWRWIDWPYHEDDEK